MSEIQLLLPAMNTLLSLDTSSEAYSVALAIDGQVYEHYFHAPRAAAAKLLPLVENMLKQHALTLKNIDAIVVTIGPGSFTGIRLGVSIAQGLAYAQDIPIIPLTTLEVLAWEAALQPKCHSDTIVSAIDARKKEAYWAIYAPCSTLGVQLNGDIQLSCPQQVLLQDASIAIGTAFYAYSELKDAMGDKMVLSPRWPRAGFAAKLALHRKAQGKAADQIQPLYVRDDIL